MAKYNKQIKQTLEAVEQSMSQLEGMIKRGDIQASLKFMREGLLRDRLNHLDNLVNIQDRDENTNIGHLS